MARRRRRVPRNARITNEIEASSGDRRFPEPTKPTTLGRTIAEAVKALFRDAKAILRRDTDAPKPQARKRRSGGDSRAVVACGFVAAAKAETTAWPLRTAATGGSIMPSEMLDRLYIWQSETAPHSSAHYSEQAGNFDAKQNCLSPQL